VRESREGPDSFSVRSRGRGSCSLPNALNDLLLLAFTPPNGLHVAKTFSSGNRNK